MPMQPEYPRAHVGRSPEGTWAIALVPAKDAYRRLHPARHRDQHVAMTIAANVVRTERANFTATRAALPPTAVVDAAAVVNDLDEQLRKERLAKLPTPIPTRCPDCKRRVRKASQKASDWPGTVAMMTRDGHCASCKKRRQAATIDAARPPKTPAQELVDAVTPPHQPKLQPQPLTERPEPTEGTAVVPAPDEDTAAMVEELEPEQPIKGRNAHTVRAKSCSQNGCDQKIATYNKSGYCRQHKDRGKPAGGNRTGHRERPMPGPDGMTPTERRAKESADAFTAARRRRGVPPEGRRTA